MLSSTLLAGLEALLLLLLLAGLPAEARSE